MAQFLRVIRDELKDFPRNPKKYPRLAIQKFESRPQVGVQSMLYRAVVKGETDKYVTSVQFYDVTYGTDKSESHDLPVKAGSKLVYYKAPSVRHNQALLKCSCPDFRFRWEKPLFDHKALIGNWRKYERKTPAPPKGAPYANPEELMGYCKHVHSLLLALRDAGYVKS